jgi:hypothetical protein
MLGEKMVNRQRIVGGIVCILLGLGLLYFLYEFLHPTFTDINNYVNNITKLLGGKDTLGATKLATSEIEALILVISAFFVVCGFILYLSGLKEPSNAE